MVGDVLLGPLLVGVALSTSDFFLERVELGCMIA